MIILCQQHQPPIPAPVPVPVSALPSQPPANTPGKQQRSVQDLQSLHTGETEEAPGAQLSGEWTHPRNLKKKKKRYCHISLFKVKSNYINNWLRLKIKCFQRTRSLRGHHETIDRSKPWSLGTTVPAEKPDKNQINKKYKAGTYKQLEKW